MSRVLREAREGKPGGSFIRPRYLRWLRKDYDAILDRMSIQRRSLSDVCNDPDLPPEDAWKRFIKIHPEFAKIAQLIHYSLPYSVQFDIRDVSPRFCMDCVQLRARGMSIEKIAYALGVSGIFVKQALDDSDERQMNTNG